MGLINKVRDLARRNGSKEVAETPLYDTKPYEAEARQQLTESRKRVNAIRKVRLNDNGVYPLQMFSPPGQATKCEHSFLRKMVLGGSQKYFCDDCEWVFILPQSFAQPKQHIVANAMMELGWVLKYDGPEAVALGLTRPHLRLDKEGHPSTPPIEVIEEALDEWKRVMDILSDFKAKQLPHGRSAPKELSANEAEGSRVLE